MCKRLDAVFLNHYLPAIRQLFTADIFTNKIYCSNIAVTSISDNFSYMGEWFLLSTGWVQEWICECVKVNKAIS